MTLNKNNKIHIARFYILYVLYYGTISLLWPFFTYYLINKDVSSIIIGTINSIAVISSIFGYYILGYIADKTKVIGKLILALLPIMIIFIILIQTSNSILIITISFCACMFMKFPFEPIIDTWALESNHETSRYFGICRSGGSVGFGVGVLIIGTQISNTSFKASFYGVYIVTAFFFFYLIYLVSKTNKNIALANKSCQKNIKSKDNKKTIHISDIKSLFAVKEYVILLILCVSFGIPASIIKIYTPFLFTHLGGGVYEHSILLGISAIAEIPFFWASPYLLKKYKALSLMAFSALFLIVSTVIYLIAPDAKYMIIAGLFITVQFGIFNPTIRYRVSQIAPQNLKATAQVVMSSSYGGISLSIGSLLGGYMLKIFEVKSTFFIAFIGLCISVSAMFMHLHFVCKKSRIDKQI